MPPSIAVAPALNDAYDAFQRADYDACVALLQGRRSSERDQLLARAYIRMKRLGDAERLLRSTAGRRRSTTLALLGGTLARQGRDAESQAYLEQAIATATNPDERAEARYTQALSHWIFGRTDEAAAILAEGDFASSSHVAESLRGFIAFRRGDYMESVRFFERAALQSGGDLMEECSSLRAASVLSREMRISSLMARVLRRMSQIEWTPHLELSRFHITRAAAWFTAIEGDYALALRQFSEASSFGVSEAFRASAMCDRAYLSLLLGEPLNGWALADEALGMASRIDWDACTDDGRMALLYLANLHAERRPIDAQRCWKRYTSLAPTEPLLIWPTEPHIAAWEAFTAASLEKSAGNHHAATEHFSRAYAIYRRIGFEWRAVLTLLARGNLNATESEYVESTLKRYPNSWLRHVAENEAQSQRPSLALAVA
ncbi:MAG TPA: hypothetical protein VIN40_07420 [Candidatus Tyrphobacter sp.]